MTNLTGTIALVTGASKGIGRATAIALAKEGCSVIINYKSDAEAAADTLKECDAYSQGNMTIVADVSREEDVARMFNDIESRYSRLDVLVNNAGIFDERDSPTNIETFEHIYRNNFLSAVIVTKYTLSLMKEGKIVNVSSIHGRLGYGRPGAIAYAAFKSALESYTKNLAKELAPHICVNAIAPGRTLTPMWGTLSEDEQKELGKGQLIGRMIEPEEIADGILFLIKNDAMCGEVMTMDGGMGIAYLK
ncbi:MAG: SDR family oxidoreductase [Candidatus Yonathbacteria bacterium]|nr:SDR family oxidoreductase [Candidatus Yonathbacteria bacterium]NTW47436.1 SDR family oxidoreductase [Candidatus Yonathbacteria bacterium]